MLNLKILLPLCHYHRPFHKRTKKTQGLRKHRQSTILALPLSCLDHSAFSYCKFKRSQKEEFDSHKTFYFEIKWDQYKLQKGH